MEFNEEYKKYKELAKTELEKIEEKIKISIQTREPLQSHILDFLSSPSKRIRPVLSILYVKALGKELNDEQLELLSTVELVHNASLIHDDIIDESKFRRGHKTISEEFDNKLGVICGDYILSIAMEKIAKLKSIEILENFSQTLNKMCQGEINQNFDRYRIGTIEEYLEKSKNKTAYLFETALFCTAMLDKTISNLETIKALGLNFGIAFQIRDDIINLTHTDTSKPTDNDITEGIYNAPVIYAQSIENYTSGIEKSKILLNNYVEMAKNQVENLPTNKYSTALREFLELLKNE